MSELTDIVVGDDVRARDIVAGEDFTCLITWANELKCFGSFSGGVLMNGMSSGRVGKSVSDMGANLTRINFGSRSTSVLAVDAGEDHVCAILGTSLPGDVVCWGSSLYGQTGYGTSSSYGAFAGQTGGEGIPANVKLGTIVDPTSSPTPSPSDASTSNLTTTAPLTLAPSASTSGQAVAENALVVGGTLGGIALIGLVALALILFARSAIGHGRREGEFRGGKTVEMAIRN